MISKVFTIEEAAEFLRLSPGYVQKLIQSGELKSFRIGIRAVRISMEQIEEYLKNRESKVSE